MGVNGEGSGPDALRAATDGGLSGDLPSASPFKFLVAPSTGDEFNTARLRLMPVACWQVDDIRFAFDSSFVDAEAQGEPGETPSDIRDELGLLSTLMEDHPGSRLSVFGHADPTGTDDYNKALSGRRAMAIYALLIANADPGKAVALWQQIASAENWGADQRQTMQDVTGLPAGTADGKLFQAYMQNLLPPELRLGKQDFLGQGADAQGKGDFQGCGEFNPLLLFSQEQQEQFDQAAQSKDQAGLKQRNAANAPNRRVMVLLFRKGSQIDPSKWPCPRATEGKAGCIKRFWSDGENRRTERLEGKQRKFAETEDTFACRFYQRITSDSPCDQILGALKIRLFDSFGQVLPRAPYVVISGNDQSKPRKADANGEIIVRSTGAGVVTIKWSRPPDGSEPEKSPEQGIVIGRDGIERLETLSPPPADQFEFERDVVVTVNEQASASAASEAGAGEPPEMTEDAARARLNNMGYLDGDQLSDLIRAFERDCDLPETGVLSEDVSAKLIDFHDVQVKSPGFSPGISPDTPSGQAQDT